MRQPFPEPLGSLARGRWRSYLNSTNRLYAHANEAAYPFYILHQTVIIAIGFFVVQWEMVVLLKFLILCAASLLVTLTLYDLVVERTNVMRFLFGMKAGRGA